MVKLSWSCASVAIAFLVIAGCGDESADDATTEGTGASGAAGGGGASQTTTGAGATTGSSGGGTTGSGGGALSFAADIWPVLSMPRNPPLSGANDSCSGTNGCHLTGAGGLSLPDMTTAYSNLIGGPSNSTLCAGILQVVASQPDDSCFVVFYEERLRDGLSWVEQPETDLVRAWVAQGAEP